MTHYQAEIPGQLPTDYSEADEAMASADHNYREWQLNAARKIVEQIKDGTLERVAKVGARIGKCSEDEAMAKQIVGVLLNFIED